MSDSYIEAAPDNSGAKIQTYQNAVGSNTVQAQAVVLVDGAGNPLTTSFQTLSITGSGNSTSTQTGFIHTIVATYSASSGVYTASLSLPIASRVPGDICYAQFGLPASNNPSVTVYNDSTAGSILYTVGGTTVAAVWYAAFVFDGSAWTPLTTNLLT